MFITHIFGKELILKLKYALTDCFFFQFPYIFYKLQSIVVTVKHLGMQRRPNSNPTHVFDGTCNGVTHSDLNNFKLSCSASKEHKPYLGNRKNIILHVLDRYGNLPHGLVIENLYLPAPTDDSHHIQCVSFSQFTSPHT